MNDFLITLGANSPPQIAEQEINSRPTAQGTQAKFQKTLKAAREKQVEDSEKDEKPKDSDESKEPKPEVMAVVIQVIVPEQLNEKPQPAGGSTEVDWMSSQGVEDQAGVSGLFIADDSAGQPQAVNKVFAETLAQAENSTGEDSNTFLQGLSSAGQATEELPDHQMGTHSGVLSGGDQPAAPESELELAEGNEKPSYTTLPPSYQAATEVGLNTASTSQASGLFESARSAETHGADMVRQIAPTLEKMAQQGESSIKLQLFPHDMGKVELTVISKKNGVEINLVAETPAAQRLLESDLNNLRQHLTASGIEIANLHVGQQPQQSFARDSQTWQDTQRKYRSNLLRTAPIIAPGELQPAYSLNATGVDYKI